MLPGERMRFPTLGDVADREQATNEIRTLDRKIRSLGHRLSPARVPPNVFGTRE